MIDVHPLFFSPVYQVSLSEDLPKLENLKKYEFVPSTPNSPYSCHMTTNTTILDDFPEEKQIILNHFYEIKNQILRHEDTEFAITRSWAMRAEKGSISQYHTHRNNFFSGVLYFDECEKDTAPLEFESPLLAHQSFAFNVTDFNVHNSRYCKLDVAKNTIMFFPSYLRHRIGYHASDKPRYSLAFNFHPIGEYGDSDSRIVVNGIK